MERDSAMPTFKIAHVLERDVQGHDVNLIIIPLESSFEHKTSHDQQREIDELQLRTQAAGLAGIVCPVWEDPSGRMGFVAPRQWHSYFQNLSYAEVYASLNRTLHW
jgi:hypothetical protein